MRKTKEEALITRENLLTAAMHVFSQKGYSATRLEDIAQEVEVTRGAIYHHFGGKEELFLALVNERNTGVNQLADKVISQGGSPREVLQRLLVSMMEYLEENDDYRAMLELSVNKVEITGGLEDFGNQITQSRRALTRYFEDLISKGIQTGEFRSDLSTEDAAISLVGFVNGLGLIWVQDPDSFSIGRRAESLVDVFLRGLLY